MPTMSELGAQQSRYGIYFCPGPSAPLYAQGSRWLGRDAMTGTLLDPGLPDHIRHEDWLRVTDSPRRYGFHATLKPPFRLADGATFDDLQTALHDFAQSHDSFYAPPLAVDLLGRFLALTLSAPSEEFSNFSADSVRHFDRLRAPATEQETAQRLRSSLSQSERAHVLQWGYPYVFDTWKFHMSLTSSMHAKSLELFEPHLRSLFAPACERPLLVDSVCIFHEPYPGGPFRLLDRACMRPL
jgi:hypothetical protein